jgi:crotonobetainyl-CoA:carnitine CoA-transferase CaiB-like acyl-CoA transferase
MGSPSWGTETRFVTASARRAFHDEIDKYIRAWTLTRDATEVESRLKQLGIPAERMRRIQDVIDSPDRSDIYRTVPERRIGSMCMTWLPFAFSAGPWRAPTSAPSLGEHTREVLRAWLDLPDQAIQDLEARDALV